ncbi:hypothetical protein ABZ618_27040 [Streptomyces roseolus]|uniref:hypothetical protein n=1 Tax=Streptomyces roseolus TaxID=67358 RepID=UPI0033E51BA6
MPHHHLSVAEAAATALDRSGLPTGMPTGVRRGRLVERRHRLAEVLTRIHPTRRSRTTDR